MNESFVKGDYSTAFIPTFYPEGYSGIPLTPKNNQTLALAAFKMKNNAITKNTFVNG